MKAYLRTFVNEHHRRHGTLPIQAITARELNASGQTDYLARTQGMALCVCHEPDSSTQQLLNDRVKVMTSDSDHLSVREMYGREKEIMAPLGRARRNIVLLGTKE